ncbi:MAG TPA: hypothetical protein DD490_06040 [Acidobacteria bacterium]|nr:hypothetical protein [Acidobacteriota bacterium]
MRWLNTVSFIENKPQLSQGRQFAAAARQIELFKRLLALAQGKAAAALSAQNGSQGEPRGLVLRRSDSVEEAKVVETESLTLFH